MTLYLEMIYLQKIEFEFRGQVNYWEGTMTSRSTSCIHTIFTKQIEKIMVIN